MKNELTVIIPCYNCDKYILKTIECLKFQTYQNFKVILIDDGSSDNTKNLLEQIKKNSNNIDVILNNDNNGAGFCRNLALKKTKTDLVTFIDSDDNIPSNYFEKMITTLKKDNSDLVFCDFKIYYEEKEEYEISGCCEGKLLKENIILNGLAASPCNKIFKTKLFDNNFFAEKIINEDIPAIIKTLSIAKKISYCKEVYYTYIQRKKSVQNSELNEKKLDIFKSLDILKQRFTDEEIKKYWNGLYFYQIILFIFYVIPKENNSKKRLQYIKSFSNKLDKNSIINNKYLNDFYEKQGKKHKLYYKYLLNLILNKKCLLANELINFYKFYQHNFRKNVLSNDKYNIVEIIKLAKKNSKKKQVDLTVIIPNYNYANFLYQRIYSILNQKVGIKELIILDDCSTDNSRRIIDDIKINIQDYINIKKVYNEKNSGSAFKQWKKGFELAKSKYVWICEADDYCNKYFLKNIFEKIEKDEKIVLSYANTGFIDKYGNIIQRNLNSDIDLLKTNHWNNDYIINGIDEIKKYSYLNCTIANVSSVVFKNDNYNEIFKKCSEFKQAGDWLFYLEIMKRGKISFISKTLNYYRIHGNNVTSTNKKELHLNEICKIHDIIKKEYKLNNIQLKNIKEREDYLKCIWKI